VLALFSLTRYQPDPYLTWKGFDWDARDRLHQQGMIGHRNDKHTLVAVTDDGVVDAVAALPCVFGLRHAAPELDAADVAAAHLVRSIPNRGGATEPFPIRTHWVASSTVHTVPDVRWCTAVCTWCIMSLFCVVR
jgi:hypothetical protein